jgi:hypothetical protein
MLFVQHELHYIYVGLSCHHQQQIPIFGILASNSDRTGYYPSAFHILLVSAFFDATAFE